jgi:type I restriction enzyme S subunit
MRCDRTKAIPEFVVAYFKTPEGQHKLLANTSQVGVPSIAQPVTYLRTIEIPLPPLPEQRAIAHILGALDDKIELNRQMNETLEAMARALFRSWFVDFDPVRAKDEGRDPGLPREVADLFPDGLEESELGEIPKGWTVGTLADHFDAVKGVSYKGSGLADTGMPLHNLNSVYEGGGYKYEGIKYYTGEYAERHVVKPGDLIVTNTEQGHDRLLIGYAAIVPRLFGERGIASHHIYRMRPKAKSPLTAGFLCYLLNSPQMHDIVSGYANGTTVNMLPIDGVQKPQVVVPAPTLVEIFDNLVITSVLRREKLIDESRTLAALRDTLLPKLISGELRVPEVEPLAGRCA